MNLIWVQLEAYGALNEVKNTILQDALEQTNFSTIHLTQAVCAAPSTVMSTMGLLTGAPPVLLAKDHIPKNQQVPDDWQASDFATITDFLETQDYDVCGINAVYDSPRCLPMFKDFHAGVTPDMKKKEGKNFWESSCILQRVKNIKQTFTKEKKALFFHLIDADILPNILTELEEIGLHKDNTVLLLVGDHGWPIRFIEKEPALFHDLHQEENNIRVACHLGFPGCENEVYSHFSSALDLAPTVLELMKYNPAKVLPKAHGKSLVSHLKNNTAVPERILRIDNRYIAQRRNKVITLLNSKLRYTFRFETNWQQQAFYQYRFSPVSEREELYLRNDIEEKNNLIKESTYLSQLEEFRSFLQKTETEIITHFYPDNFFEHYIFSELTHVKQQNDNRKHSSLRIQQALLKLILADHQDKKIAIYGAGNHTRSLLSLNIINQSTTVILDDNPLCAEIEGIPVQRSADFHQFNFDILLLSSDYFEEQLYEQALKWLPPKINILRLYSELGPALTKKILTKAKDSDFARIADTICTLFDINDALIMTENPYSYSDAVLNTKESECLIVHASDNVERMNNHLLVPTVPSDLSSKTIQKKYSYLKIQKKIKENKLDLVLHQCKNTYEAIEWFSRAEEILDTCGFYLMEVPAKELNEGVLNAFRANDNLLVSIEINQEKIIILACLWLFNS